MQISKNLVGRKLTIKAVGRLDVTTAPDYGEQVMDCIEDNNVTDLILDFMDINYISSMGLRVILELQKKMNTLGKMKVINAQLEVMAIFSMTGFDKILIIE